MLPIKKVKLYIQGVLFFEATGNWNENLKKQLFSFSALIEKIIKTKESRNKKGYHVLLFSFLRLYGHHN